LIVIVIDNETYEATGGPASFTAGRADLAGMARAAGVPNTWLVRDLEAFDSAGDAPYRGDGASLNAAQGPPSTRGAGHGPLDGPENKYRFVRYVERTEKLNILKKPKKALPQDVKPR